MPAACLSGSFPLGFPHSRLFISWVRVDRQQLNVGGANYTLEYDYDGAKRRLTQLRHGLYGANLTMDFGYETGANRKGVLTSIIATGAYGEPNQTFTYAYEPNTSWVKTITAGSFTHNRGYESTRNMVASTSNKWGETSRDSASYKRDKIGRITTLNRSGSIFDVYEGGGLEQNFDYTSRGELSRASTASTYNSETPLPGRRIELFYDGQGNRTQLKVDYQVSHTYTPGPANEYLQVNYGAHAGAISGVSDYPGNVAVGNDLAERQASYFYRGFLPGANASWTFEDIFAADNPPSGGYVTAYTAATKELYLPPASVAPEYDEAGNLKKDGWWEYEYDGENRLIKIVSAAHLPNSTSKRELLFKYDYLGRRVQKTVRTRTAGGGVITNSDTAFAYWDWHLLAEIDLGDSSPWISRHYAWGLDKEGVRPGAGGVGGLLMVVDRMYNRTYLALNDYIGNVVGLLDPDNGNMVAEYEYDPFGRTIRATGTYADKNPIRFSSQYTDNETGLVYFGFRYYHPQWGRFINRDPIEEAGGENLYRFVSNDPVNRWDLLGLMYGMDVMHSYEGQMALDAFAHRPAAPPDGSGPRWGQFAKGALSFGSGAILAGVASATAPVQAATGIGIAALVVEASAAAGAMSYGISNMVAAFSPDEAKAAMVESAPSSAPQLIGRAIGGQAGQEMAALGEMSLGGVSALKTGAKLLDGDVVSIPEKVSASVEAVNYGASIVESAANGQRSPFPTLEGHRDDSEPSSLDSSSSTNEESSGSDDND